MIDLTAKVALITGSSRGIGRACAIEMARAGADICVNYRTHPAEAEEVAAEIRDLGRRAIVIGCDVSDRAAVDAMVAQTVAELGPLDIAVANAYYSKREPFLELSLDAMRQTLDVTLWGAFHLAQSTARQMNARGQGGALLFITSVLAQIPMPTSLPYNTAKAGVEHMCATIARELAPHKIRANAIEPGWTDTPGERQFTSEDEIRRGAEQLPWGRLATSEDIANAAVFLCSDAADYITGSVLKVDGGYTLKPPS
ncbi:MAG: glucose 1-dehydrogenase [Candidatus Latescibacterota bacterium]|nr:glucose 1-dehydrogenase [Candidatus Latescibacterota bacterium]